jgi:transcriptional regulator with XRE-family HTH domain
MALEGQDDNPSSSAVAKELNRLWRLARSRSAERYTKADLARDAGVAESTLSDWFRGRHGGNDPARLAKVGSVLAARASVTARTAREWSGLVDHDRQAPGAQPRQAETRTVRQFDPFLLGLHPALMPSGGASGPVQQRTPYFERDHDEQLRKAIVDAASGGLSALAVLVGESCTGKTRALYEAIAGTCGDRELLCPSDADELIEVLERRTGGGNDAGQGSVLWLDELQRILYNDPGGTAATRLRRALD